MVIVGPWQSDLTGGTICIELASKTLNMQDGLIHEVVDVKEQQM